MTECKPGHCQECGMPGLVYPTYQEPPEWLCDECTAVADLHHERDSVYEQEARHRGSAGHNDPRVDGVEVRA